MPIREDSIRQFPDFPWLSLEDRPLLDRFLHERGWLAEDEQVIRSEKPGEGNMNLTLRVITDRRSLIVKQSRPWVEKYDRISAPWDRSAFECQFYRRIQDLPQVGDRMPRLIHSDQNAHVLVLEDLGDAEALNSLYQRGRLQQAEIESLADYLRNLHDATRGTDSTGFENLQMRQLNHQHIYEIPLLVNNGIDLEGLEPGLSAAAAPLRSESNYRNLVESTGARYLQTGPVLLHGDYFPGSWLRTANGVYVIDPEFCFYGDPEFDLGCAVAHLRLAALPFEHAQAFLNAYTTATTTSHRVEIDSSLLSCYAAIEVMRRLIGVAQLPLPTSGFDRSALLEQSRRATIQQSWEALWDTES